MTPTPPSQPGDLTPELRQSAFWTDELVASAGIPVIDVPFVTVGGGFGSFVMADVLRISGVPTDQIKVVTLLENPWDQYQYLATNSQIPGHERLRSDSASCPDNIWGFPSYAWREAWETKSPKHLFGVATEPILADYFTPKAEQVYRTTAKEAKRIGWEQMKITGRARMIRKRTGGGYYVCVTPPDGTTPTKRIALRCRWVHVAVGYPGVKFLDDLQEYRDKYQDFQRVVNAYEPHDHVYEKLLGNGGDVLVRGSGIVASRVFQRLLDDVEKKGARTRVFHLFRNYVAEAQGPPKFRREAANGFNYQAFNYPKAAWGGTLRERLIEVKGKERADLIKTMGGTNTAKRKDWVAQLDRARSNGVYAASVGVVQDVMPTSDGRILTKVRTKEGQDFDIPADFIIDATGLDADIRRSQLLDDMLDFTGAGQNPLGRLDVADSFEIIGTRADPGRVYASGSITLGGPYAGVDSFLGLQYVAIQIADDLAEQGFGNRIGPGRSVSQWFKWARGKSPD